MAVFNNYPDILTVKQVGEMLRIGRNNAYELVRSGKIKSLIIMSGSLTSKRAK